MTGTTLSHYRINSELGRGGMGIVYLAEDTKLDRHVAIKVLPPSALASKDDRARFYREAKAAAALNHPNIAQIYEIDEAVPGDAPYGTEPSPFIAMEYIEGETLDKRIRKGPLKLKDAVSIAVQIGGAIGAAHQKDIVHRDVKASNVMLTSTGDAKVLDFGLALTAASTKLTRMGSTLGTVAYMSPEQARGEEVDRRTDLWALGVVLYEMISGRNPFGGDYEQAIVYNILNVDPEPLTAVRTGVPMELERIVNKCLLKDSRRRYQSAADLIADLGGVDVSKITSASLSGDITPPVTTSSGRMIAFGMAFILLGVLIGVGAMLLRSTPDPDPRTEAAKRFEVRVPRRGHVNSIALSPDARWLGVVGGGAVLVRNMTTGEVHDHDFPGAGMMSWSRDGTQTVISAINGIYRADADGSDPILLRSERGLKHAVFGPAGEVLYSTYGSWIVTVPQVGSPDTMRWEGSIAPAGMTPAGDVLVGNIQEGSFQSSVWDIQTGSFEQLERPAMVLTRSGHALLSGGQGQASVYPIDLDSFSPVGPTIPITYLNETIVALSDGGTLAYHDPAASDEAFELRVRRSSGTDEMLTGNVLDPEFALSPGADRIVVRLAGEADGEAMTVLDLETRLETQIAAGALFSDPAWSPDGLHIYGFRQQSLVVTPADRSELPRHVLDSPQGVEPIEWIPGGDNFLWSQVDLEDGFDIGIGLFDTQTDSLSWIVEPEGLNAGIELSPDGRYLGYFVFEDDISELPPMTILELETGRTWRLPLDSGADYPRWSVDGDAVEYEFGDSLMAIPVDTRTGFRTTGPPEVVAILPGLVESETAADGDIYYTRRIANTAEEQDNDDNIVINFVVDWFEELERIAPTN